MSFVQWVTGPDKHPSTEATGHVTLSRIDIAGDPQRVADWLGAPVAKPLEGLDVEWVAVPYALDDAATVERLCRAALERGGGIRVGIGDNPSAFGDLANAALVERATTWCAESGRAVATSGDVRARVGITPR